MIWLYRWVFFLHIACFTRHCIFLQSVCYSLNCMCYSLFRRGRTHTGIYIISTQHLGLYLYPGQVRYVISNAIHSFLFRVWMMVIMSQHTWHPSVMPVIEYRFKFKGHRNPGKQYYKTCKVFFLYKFYNFGWILIRQLSIHPSHRTLFKSSDASGDFVHLQGPSAQQLEHEGKGRMWSVTVTGRRMAEPCRSQSPRGDDPIEQWKQTGWLRVIKGIIPPSFIGIIK